MAFVRSLNQWPFCQVDSREDLPVDTLSDITTDGWPVAATEDEWMEWLWRVRLWRMSGAMSLSWTQSYEAGWTDPDPPYNYTDGPWTASAFYEATLNEFTEGQYGQGAEESLVCSAALGGAASDSGAVTVADSYPDRSPGYASTFSWSLNWGMPISTPRWRESSDGETYYPRLTFSGSLVVGPVSATWSSVYEEETAGNHYSYTTLDFAGHLVPIQLVWNDAFGSLLAEWTVTLTIEPYEWYEHDPGDGLGPVWDSATGERTARSMPNP